MSSQNFEIKSKVKVFGGTLTRFQHLSRETKTPMVCAVFLPDDDASHGSVPLLVYLSGLTCSDENVCQKSGVFESLARHKIGLVAPDTSPRGAGIAGESDCWDFGVGAGFYVDATVPEWSENYRMYSYITKELPAVLSEHFPQLDHERKSIFGHSMGGHGALTIAFKNPSQFKSVSAFAPICKPSSCPWGQKAFTGYLGSDQSNWQEYDACALLSRGRIPQFDDILIDVGTADGFLTKGQLQPEELSRVAAGVGQTLSMRYQEGYDHSYFFIATFIAEHVAFHAARLCSM